MQRNELIRLTLLGVSLLSGCSSGGATATDAAHDGAYDAGSTPEAGSADGGDGSCEAIDPAKVTFLEGSYKSACGSTSAGLGRTTLEIHLDQMTRRTEVSTEGNCYETRVTETVRATFTIGEPNFYFQDAFNIDVTTEEGEVRYNFVQVQDGRVRFGAEATAGALTAAERPESLGGLTYYYESSDACVGEIPEPPPWEWPLPPPEQITAQYSSVPFHGGAGLLYHDETLFVSTNHARIHLLRRDGTGGWVETQTLTSESTRLVARGDVLLAPEPMFDAQRGQIRVFKKDSQGVWVADTILTAPRPDAWALYGHSISFDGTRLLVGEPEGWDFNMGFAYAYVFDGQSFTFEQKLPRTNVTFNNRDTLFGRGVAIFGERAAVFGGGYIYFLQHDTTEGWQIDERIDAPVSRAPSLVRFDAEGLLEVHRDGLRIYHHDGSAWGLAESIAFSGDATLDERGQVAMEGSRIAAGGFFANAPDGSPLPRFVRIFERGAGGWGEIQDVSNVDSATPTDHFGYGVSLAGQALFVGNPDLEFPADRRRGMVYEFALP
ncbi:MAG: hypothetical protein JRH20_15235 [Deltaproteobacteria bacterium]|nr:hypothetical protein [Deltaproteobacteria bacterium]